MSSFRFCCGAISTSYHIMVDVDTSRLYEVLPMDIPASAPAAWSANPNLKHSKSYNGSSVLPPMSYSTYAVPRGVNGTPPTSRTIPPAVPPRNRNMSEGEGHHSQGNSPNDKGGLFPMRSKSSSGERQLDYYTIKSIAVCVMFRYYQVS